MCIPVPDKEPLVTQSTLMPLPSFVPIARPRPVPARLIEPLASPTSEIVRLKPPVPRIRIVEMSSVESVRIVIPWAIHRPGEKATDGGTHSPAARTGEATVSIGEHDGERAQAPGLGAPHTASTEAHSPGSRSARTIASDASNIAA